MTGLEISVLVRPEKRKEFLNAIDLLSAREIELQDLRSIEVFEQCGKQNHFLWIERWASDALAEERKNSNAFHALLGAIKILGELRSLDIVTVERSDAAAGDVKVNRKGDLH